MADTPYNVGTRGSPLALAQAELAIQALTTAHQRPSEAFRIQVVQTVGDKVQNRPLAEIGGKALWTKELDRALRDGEAEFAVHSLKDVETFIAEGIVIAAILERADPRDRLIGADSLESLPHRAKVGTSSPRRAALLRARRPDLDVVSIRGNVATRLSRIENGDMDATLLAAAGLDRLGIEIGTLLEVDDWLPAVAQGAIAITCRADNHEMVKLLSAINHQPSWQMVHAERALLAAINGNCHSAIGVHARPIGEGQLRIDAELLSADGQESVRDHIEGLATKGEELATVLGERMLAKATPAIRATLA